MLDQSKFGVFADVKMNLAAKLKFVLGRVQNIVGKGENADYLDMLLFFQCFLKTSSLGEC